MKENIQNGTCTETNLEKGNKINHNIEESEEKKETGDGNKVGGNGNEEQNRENQTKHIENKTTSCRNMMRTSTVESSTGEINKNANKTLSKSCKFFVERKKRNCRVLIKADEEYCAEHRPIKPLNEEGMDENKRRIPCPYDSKHSCYAVKLRKHLKICNARPKAPIPFIEKGFNVNESCEDGLKRLNSFSNNEIINLIQKINKICSDKLIDKITEKFKTHHVVEQEISNPAMGHEYGPKRLKHLNQNSSLLALMDEYKLINSNSCFIEFGAGRGQLTYWMHLAANDPNSSFVLIERASPKHKKDNKLAYNGSNISRIRANIADVILDKLDEVNRADFIVGVTKHLCGEATDLAMQCLTNVEKNKKKVKGCLMSFCCHHACRWSSYVGKEWFNEINLSQEDFEMMCGMSSWAVSGSGLSREVRKSEQSLNSNKTDKLGLGKEEKKEIGLKIKRIINWGRLNYLEKQGFNCKMHYYCDTSTTLENMCLIAYK